MKFDSITQNALDAANSSQTKFDPVTQAALQNAQIPSDVSEATNLGEQSTSSKYNGYCQQFVDDVLQTPAQNRMPTADAAWNNYSQQGLAHSGTDGIQSGDLIYFQDPNDPAGHVGLYSGNGKFISATQVDPQNPVQNQSIAAWQDLTGQKVLGYVKNPENLPQIGGSQ